MTPDELRLNLKIAGWLSDVLLRHMTDVQKAAAIEEWELLTEQQRVADGNRPRPVHPGIRRVLGAASKLAEQDGDESNDEAVA